MSDGISFQSWPVGISLLQLFSEQRLLKYYGLGKGDSKKIIKLESIHHGNDHKKKVEANVQKNAGHKKTCKIILGRNVFIFM